MPCKSLINQALVSIGGRALRLRVLADFLPQFDTKSFLKFAGKPALYWTLSGLRRAGISNVVLAGERSELLARGRAVAIEVGFASEQIAVYQDNGRGVHGLPHHASGLLDSRFIFEAGHGMAPSTHYYRLRHTPAGYIAYSTFPYDPKNNSRTLVYTKEGTQRAVALPYSLDSHWAESIADLDYDIASVIATDLDTERATFIEGNFVPEFDVITEYMRVRRRMLGIALAQSVLRSITNRVR